MKPLAKKPRKRPEDQIRDDIRDFMTLRGWYVIITHGNMFQSGLPDLWTTHTRYGARWVEVKKPGMKGSRFTAAQLDSFPNMCANGSGVWVLTAANEDEYEKLFKPFNWWQYTDAFK